MVQFTSTSVNSEAFHWDFGDGSTSRQENPVHIYSTAGTFDVRLEVSNKKGSDIASLSVPISSPPGGSLITAVVHSVGLEDNLLGDSPDRDVTIYLPPGYEESGERYPVIYLLHGYAGNDRLWFGTGYTQVDLEPVMDYLIYRKTIEPMILVSPDSYNRFMGSWYINSVSSGNWEDFIVQDVVQYVDEHYRTIADPESRGIAGHSMGGYGTVMLAIKHPDVFSAAYALSSAALVFDPDPYPYMDYYRTVYTEILAADEITDFASLSWDAKSTLAMGVAMVPNPSSPPFYYDYFFTRTMEFVPEVWDRLIAFDPYTSLTTYEQNVLQLTALYLDCGEADGLVASNVRFAEKLAWILGLTRQDVFESYEGDHSDKLELRMESEVLPFFSENLKHEVAE